MATSTLQMTAPVPDQPNARGLSRSPEKTVLIVGAAAAGTGTVMQVILEHLHPHRAQPNESVAAFSEYAHAHGWAAIHIGQFFGALLIVFALLVLCQSLVRQPGVAGALARGGGVVAVVLVSMFAVQMAVDGVALAHAVDTWAGAAGTEKRSALQLAEEMRSLEKGLSGFFHLLNGTALLAIGASIVKGQTQRSWCGWAAIAAGVGFLAGGASTATTGFSTQSATILQPSLLLLVVFLAGTYSSMLRTGSRSRP